jgi:hypothetical protein
MSFTKNSNSVVVRPFIPHYVHDPSCRLSSSCRVVSRLVRVVLCHNGEREKGLNGKERERWKDSERGIEKKLTQGGEERGRQIEREREGEGRVNKIIVT